MFLKTIVYQGASQNVPDCKHILICRLIGLRLSLGSDLLSALGRMNILLLDGKSEYCVGKHLFQLECNLPCKANWKALSVTRYINEQMNPETIDLEKIDGNKSFGSKS